MKEQVLIALARCRLLEESMLESLMGLTHVVAESLVELRLVEKQTMGEGEEGKVIYALTDKGEVYVRKNLPEMGELYRGFVDEQDLKLCDFYLRRSKEEQASWKTRDDFIKQYKLPGVVDGAFINANGELEAVKIVSSKSNYSTVQKVENFLKIAEIGRISYLVC